MKHVCMRDPKNIHVKLKLRACEKKQCHNAKQKKKKNSGPLAKFQQNYNTLMFTTCTTTKKFYAKSKQPT